ncbi:hypothetical protein LXL04_000380 [Taraxacum kok-saghyz]
MANLGFVRSLANFGVEQLPSQYMSHDPYGRQMFKTRNVIVQSRSFENSYIPENPRTPKPLTFSKNRLRGAKNRSNISPVAKKFFRKNDFFFPKLYICANFFFLCICAQFFVLFQNRSKTRNVFKFFYRSLYNTYLKRFVKKNLKKNAKKKLHICTKNKKKRIVMIKNVLEGSEVGFLKGITAHDRFLKLTCLRRRSRLNTARIGILNGVDIHTKSEIIWDFGTYRWEVVDRWSNERWWTGRETMVDGVQWSKGHNSL